jgi:hypothetical protein
VNPHLFNADLDPAFFLIADPDPVLKDAEATGEALGPQKRTFITSKHENS